jgi:hypothetical protein
MSDEGDQWAQNVLIERRAFGFPGRRIETAGLPIHISRICWAS